MRIRRVRLRYYRGVIDSDVCFSPEGVTIVEGPNEVGKSSLAEALHLAIEYPDTSRNATIKSIAPARRDKGPEVEIGLSSGEYELTYLKRWLKLPKTELTVTAPKNDNLKGREAHDRLKTILEETLDSQLWKALRIEQGAEPTLPLLNSQSLSRSLDQAAGGDVATDRDDALWDRIKEEYEKHWTSTGKPKPDRKASESSVEKIQSEVNTLEEQLEEIEDDTKEMRRLDDKKRQLNKDLTRSHKDKSDLTEQWESTKKLRDRRVSLTENYELAKGVRDGAAVRHHQRREQIRGLETQEGALTKLKEEKELADDSGRGAEQHHGQAEEELKGARDSLRSIKSLYEFALRDREHLRQIAEIAQLEKRRENYRQADKDLREAEKFLDSAKITSDLAKQIEEAYFNFERAKAAADIAAASVETTAICDTTIRIDGKETKLAGGETKRVPVNNEVTVEIPEIAAMRVQAGTDSKKSTERLDVAARKYRNLCNEGGVADHLEARKQAQARKDTENKLKEAKATMEKSLGELALEDLDCKIEYLEELVASYTQERPEDRQLPPDLGASNDIAADLESSVREEETIVRSREDTVKEAQDELQECRINQKVLASNVESARNIRDNTSRRLEADRQDRGDEELQTDFEDAEERVYGIGKELKEIEKELKAADSDSLDDRLETARGAYERAKEENLNNDNRRRELRVRLDVRGEKGLYSDCEAANARLFGEKRRHESLEARARAAKLLKETFEKHRKQAHQSYIEPLREKIEDLGKLVFGSTFAVELSDDLQLVRRTLSGTTLDVDQLSIGAREQLGVLSRLACASIVSPDDDGAPVMIDDALGWSDPQRLKKMGAAIAAAGKNCQIIILTCTPGRYSHIGGSPKVVQL